MDQEDKLASGPENLHGKPTARLGALADEIASMQSRVLH